VPGAGGPDAAADPEQWGRPVGAGEHDQAQVRRSLSASALASPGGEPYWAWSARRKPSKYYCICMCAVE